MTFNIVSRSMWQAQDVQETVSLLPIKYPVKHVFFTHTNTYECSNLGICGAILRNLQDKAIRKKFLDDVYYNFIIGGDGNVYEGRGWAHYPMLPYKHQHLTEDAIYVSFFGQFLEQRPGDQLRKARFDLLQHGVQMGFLASDFVRHDIIFKPRPFTDNAYTQYNYNTRGSYNDNTRGSYNDDTRGSYNDNTRGSYNDNTRGSYNDDTRGSYNNDMRRSYKDEESQNYDSYQ